MKERGKGQVQGKWRDEGQIFYEARKGGGGGGGEGGRRMVGPSVVFNVR